jgi:hypothetical protein
MWLHSTSYAIDFYLSKLPYIFILNQNQKETPFKFEKYEVNQRNFRFFTHSSLVRLKPKTLPYF